MNTILTVENVCKNYGSFTALNNVSISVPKGSVFGLLGPNGAGKTSLIRIINQITLQDSGTIFLDGEPLKPQHVHQIGYLPEERGLYKSMKVGEQALYLAQLKGLSKSDAKKKLKYWFEKFEIGDWWDKKIQELSKNSSTFSKTNKTDYAALAGKDPFALTAAEIKSLDRRANDLAKRNSEEAARLKAHIAELKAIRAGAENAELTSRAVALNKGTGVLSTPYSNDIIQKRTLNKISNGWIGFLQLSAS